ncbi:MAG: hypothetical protein JKY25_06720 [Robiginitomaculum sp.]|nr:hypothetical protein [Robiginitomaculum sp.]
MDMNKQEIQELLKAGRKPDTDMSLLQVRILKSAKQTPQDGLSTGASYTNFASWKSVVATLILTTGIGFGLGQFQGQAASENTDYLSAEALLSFSIASDYDETGLEPDQEGDP